MSSGLLITASNLQTTCKNKSGTAQVGAPLKVKKIKVFYIYKSTLLLKFHYFHSAKLYLKG